MQESLEREQPPRAAPLLAQTGPPARGTALARTARGILLSDSFILYLTLLLYVAASVAFPALSNPGSIANYIQNIWPLLAVAIGQTFVLIIGGIDLSVGSTMAITSVIGAVLMAETLEPAMFNRSPLWGTLITESGGLLAGSPNAVVLGVGAMLAVGVAIGCLNGVIITRFNLAPFMVTLVTSTFFSAFALWLTQSRNVSGLPEAFTVLGSGDIVSIYLGVKATPEIARRDILPLITYPLLISGGLALAAQFILGRTVFGRQMFSIGTNRRASEISGLPVRGVIIRVYMFSGFCAAVASILYSARLGIGQPSLGGGNLLLDIIGASVIGGTSLFGGKGSVRGTVFGVAFFVLLLPVLNAMRMSPFIIDAVKGGVILLAALLDITRTRLLNREARA